MADNHPSGDSSETPSAAKRPRVDVTQRPQPPNLAHPELKLQFSQFLHNRLVRKIKIDPTKIVRVFKAVYHAMDATLGGVLAPPLEEEVFVRVCQSLVLRRLQDLEESRQGIVPTNRVPIARAGQVPQPVGELLYSLGYYEQTAPYRRYQPVCVAIDTASPQPWSAITPEQRGHFYDSVTLTAGRYMSVQFPPHSYYFGEPLFDVMKQVHDDGREQCLLFGDKPTPADIYLRFVHEDFVVNPPFPNSECDGIGTQLLHPEDVILQYASSYITRRPDF
ncbi:hypothetical protein DMENIID0001_009240 [Sergentomyia squamirostris]